jgi:hypothetical protein
MRHTIAQLLQSVRMQTLYQWNFNHRWNKWRNRNCFKENRFEYLKCFMVPADFVEALQTKELWDRARLETRWKWICFLMMTSY